MSKVNKVGCPVGSSAFFSHDFMIAILGFWSVFLFALLLPLLDLAIHHRPLVDHISGA